MARSSATSPAARLQVLERARARAKKIKRGDVLGAVPMAELLEVTWQTLRGWCREIPGFAASGVFEAGSQGVDYRFQPAATVRFLIAHFTAERERRANRARRMAEIVGGRQLAEAPEAYSLDELAKMVQLSARIQEQRERQGRLIDAERAAAALREYNSALQQAVLRAGQEQDPNGRWEPEAREAFEDAMRSILLQMERAGRACLEALGQGRSLPARASGRHEPTE